MSDTPPVTPIRYNDLGQPTLRVRKDILAVGSYTPPNRSWTLNVETDRLHKLARRFSAMRADGINVPIISVDAKGAHNWKPENTRGYLRDVAVEGDRLMGEIELIGDDAVKLAGRTEVSVSIHPDYRGGNGRDYGEAIDHVAVTSCPVMPNQKNWRIAASRGGQADDREELCLSMPAASFTEANTMALSAEALKALSDKIGQPVTADNIVELFTKQLSAGEANAKAAADLVTVKAELSAAKDEAATLKGQLDKAPKPIELSREASDALTDAMGVRLLSLVEKGKITPAVKTKLEGALAQPYMLSRGTAEKSPATVILEALAENEPVKLGEQSGGQQGKQLSRETPGGGDNSTADDLVNASIARVGGKITK